VKTKLYTTLLVASLLFTFACKKSNSGGSTDTPTTTKPKKYLTRIITVSSAPGPNGTATTTTSSTYYTYDSKKRLSTVKSGDNIITYTYADDGNLYTINNTVSPTSSSTIEFTYADGKLKLYTLRSFKGNQVQSETPYVYVYEGDRVTEIHWEIYYAKFTYDDKGNIVKMFHYGDPQYSSVYTYDDKKSMFINLLSKYPTAGDMGGGMVSLNNRVTSTTEGLNQNVLSTYKYNYDDEGYPTGAVMTASIVNSVTSKYTYEYSTLD
jgi:uncharacterized lipoprotein YehR (DUF1307 family)